MVKERLLIQAEVFPEFATVLTPEALDFVAELQSAFNGRRLELLARRAERQADISAGVMPDFLPETADIRAAEWTVAPIPDDLQDRRVEITGPVDRKMIINALNSGASIFMADFEDSHAPTWAATIEGQINLRDAVNRAITFDSPEGKRYRLNDKTAVLLVRPRGWHLNEKHATLDGQPVSASLFDFGLYFFHNAHNLIARGTGPYFYLPKLESHREARLWNDVFVRAYSQLVIKTCHRRNVHAMGGMAAQIPIKNDPEANEAALAKVRADKEREARDGHDGTWVAHPGLVGIARDIFDQYMPTPNQIFRKREDVHVTAADLLAIPSGTITAAGLRTNIDVGIQYMAAWLSGNGCVPIYNLMEDAATAEISRSQIWQWLHNPNARLDDGRAITVDLFRGLTAEVLAELRAKVGDEFFAANNYELAARLFDEISVADQFTDFLTLKAYEYLN